MLNEKLGSGSCREQELSVILIAESCRAQDFEELWSALVRCFFASLARLTCFFDQSSTLPLHSIKTPFLSLVYATPRCLILLTSQSYADRDKSLSTACTSPRFGRLRSWLPFRAFPLPS